MTNDADISAFNSNLVVENNKNYYIARTSENKKISINTATEAALDNLPGIGEAFAKRIVEYRQSNGPFKSLEDLKKVKGIGDSLFEQLKDLICL